jgi:hypothetical protein
VGDSLGDLGSYTLAIQSTNNVAVVPDNNGAYRRVLKAYIRWSLPPHTWNSPSLRRVVSEQIAHHAADETSDQAPDETAHPPTDEVSYEASNKNFPRRPPQNSLASSLQSFPRSLQQRFPQDFRRNRPQDSRRNPQTHPRNCLPRPLLPAHPRKLRSLPARAHPFGSITPRRTSRSVSLPTTRPRAWHTRTTSRSIPAVPPRS